jgi:cell volume regulation protein A
MLAAVVPVASEPTATALLLTTFAVLLGLSIVMSHASERVGIPIVLVFLLIGMVAGSEGLGHIPFDDYAFSFRLGTIALVFILFDGGLNTSLAAVRQFGGPVVVLATLGVLGTALVVAVGGRVLGLDWSAALLLGAVVSSTDAAAVFAVLRGSGIQLKRRVGVTLEAESGINDPVAVLLTTALTQNLVQHGSLIGWHVALDVGLQMSVGGALGIATGFGGRWLLSRVRLPGGGLYAVLSLALACFAFGATTVLHGSGFLAVYVAAVVLGDGPLPYRAGLLRVHDAMGWLSQITMFLVLGLLVVPSRLLAVAPLGLALALVLAFIARPVVVSLCLAPFRYPRRDMAFIGWVGLRGAVPIVLALFPVLGGAPGAQRIFNLVFFIVVVTAVVPGGTVAWAARRLRLESSEPPGPPAILEIESREPLTGELLSFYIDEALDITGVPLAELPFPESASVTLIVRGRELIAPKGATVLEPGDHIYVLTTADDRALVQLLFGRPERGWGG